MEARAAAGARPLSQFIEPGLAPGFLHFLKQPPLQRPIDKRQQLFAR